MQISASNGDMKMSSAPSFGAPGGHFFDVVAQGLKKHVFTAMLALGPDHKKMVFFWVVKKGANFG